MDRQRVAGVLGMMASCVVLGVGCDCSGTVNNRIGDSDAGPTLAVDGGEACGDGLDEDGDGRIDEDCVCAPGSQQRCFAGDPALAGVGACAWGQQDCSLGGEFGEWDECAGQGEPSEEACDGVDNDCDGDTDEDCECVTGEERDCYDGAPGSAGVGLCVSGRERCENGSWSGQCEGSVVPAAELCNGAGDEDCDGQIDEGCACTTGVMRDCYGAAPETRDVGDCRAGQQLCVGDSWGTCDGEVGPSSEACTGGRDEDCDGATDCDDPDCETAPACCSPFNQTVPIVPPEAEILFVVDRSGSMDWPALGTTRTRWQELRSAMDAVLPSLGDLHTGLLTFPLLTGDTERYNCLVASTPEIPLSLDNGATIATRLMAADPRAGDTPTPSAIVTASNYLASVPSARPRFVVLATDGLPEPNCGATVEATVNAISALRTNLGVETFVLGIVGPDPSGSTAGIDDLRAALNLMADAGGRPRTGTLRYYEAVDGPALTRALRAIMAAATDCHVELASEPARPSAIEVRQNGTLVPPTDYTLSGRRLEFSGSWCEAIRAGSVTSITVSDTCT